MYHLTGQVYRVSRLGEHRANTFAVSREENMTMNHKLMKNGSIYKVYMFSNKPTPRVLV